MGEVYVYYLYQCLHCYIISGQSGRTPEDALRCCHGNQMIALRREVKQEPWLLALQRGITEPPK